MLPSNTSHSIIIARLDAPSGTSHLSQDKTCYPLSFSYSICYQPDNWHDFSKASRYLINLVIFINTQPLTWQFERTHTTSQRTPNFTRTIFINIRYLKLTLQAYLTHLSHWHHSSFKCVQAHSCSRHQVSRSLN